MDKRVEVKIGDFDEEICRGRRRSGRIAKTWGQYKQMANHSQEEEDDTNSKESDKNSGDGMDKGKEEMDKYVEKWDDTLGDTQDFELENTTKDPSLNPTHVSTTITLPSIVNQEYLSITNASPNTNSSLVGKEGQECLKDHANIFDVQVKQNPLENCSRTLKLETKENEPITCKEHKELIDRCMAMEEGFNLFSKFTLKVMHMMATTLQLLANKLEEENLGKEDTKLHYNFLTEDWVKVLVDGKGKKKEAS